MPNGNRHPTFILSNTPTKGHTMNDEQMQEHLKATLKKMEAKRVVSSLEDLRTLLRTSATLDPDSSNTPKRK